MMPWIFLLFIGVLDFGFYAYSAICTQNAARAAAIQASSDVSTVTFSVACNAALGEITWLPNARTLTTCQTSPSDIDDAHPLAVAVQELTATTSPACADCALNSSAVSAQASVTYRSIQLFPIPGIMMGRMTMTRVAEARIIQ